MQVFLIVIEILSISMQCVTHPNMISLRKPVILFIISTVNLFNASVMHLSPLQFKNLISQPEKIGNSDTSKLFLIDEAEDFMKQYPEETKNRLGLIVDKMDKDKNGSITAEELTNWIDFIHKDHIRRDVEREWVIRNPDQVAKLPWSL